MTSTTYDEMAKEAERNAKAFPQTPLPQANSKPISPAPAGVNQSGPPPVAPAKPAIVPATPRPDGGQATLADGSVVQIPAMSAPATGIMTQTMPDGTVATMTQNQAAQIPQPTYIDFDHNNPYDQQARQHVKDVQDAAAGKYGMDKVQWALSEKDRLQRLWSAQNGQPIQPQPAQVGTPPAKDPYAADTPFNNALMGYVKNLPLPPFSGYGDHHQDAVATLRGGNLEAKLSRMSPEDRNQFYENARQVFAANPAATAGARNQLNLSPTYQSDLRTASVAEASKKKQDDDFNNFQRRELFLRDMRRSDTAADADAKHKEQMGSLDSYTTWLHQQYDDVAKTDENVKQRLAEIDSQVKAAATNPQGAAGNIARIANQIATNEPTAGQKKKQADAEKQAQLDTETQAKAIKSAGLKAQIGLAGAKVPADKWSGLVGRYSTQIDTLDGQIAAAENPPLDADGATKTKPNASYIASLKKLREGAQSKLDEAQFNADAYAEHRAQWEVHGIAVQDDPKRAAPDAPQTYADHKRVADKIAAGATPEAAASGPQDKIAQLHEDRLNSAKASTVSAMARLDKARAEYEKVKSMGDETIIATTDDAGKPRTITKGELGAELDAADRQHKAAQATESAWQKAYDDQTAKTNKNQPAAPPSAATQPSGSPRPTATGPNGEKIELRDGQWVGV